MRGEGQLQGDGKSPVFSLYAKKVVSWGGREGLEKCDGENFQCDYKKRKVTHRRRSATLNNVNAFEKNE